MADVVDRATRSRMMSGIRGKNTIPERLVRSYLHRSGLRFRLHVKGLPGRPDLVLPRYKAIVEVHGCFWHRHPHCRFATTPATNRRFWGAKFRENTTRDRRNRRRLEQLGWRVFTIWECEIKESRKLAILVRRIRAVVP
jgi:DNA mismatch endonuclease (patch repair protein)